MSEHLRVAVRARAVDQADLATNASPRRSPIIPPGFHPSDLVKPAVWMRTGWVPGTVIRSYEREFE